MRRLPLFLACCVSVSSATYGGDGSRTRTFSDVVTLGRSSSDHHKGPVIWADRDERLHVLYGCHRTPGTHLVSRQPGTIGRDLDAWKDEDAPEASAFLLHEAIELDAAPTRSSYQ